MIRKSPTPSTSFLARRECEGRVMTWTLTPRSFARTRWSTIMASWYRSFCTNRECLASSMKSPIRSRAALGHQIRLEGRRGSNGWRLQSASKAFDHFRYFVRIVGNDGEVAGLLEIVRVPVQGADERSRIVHHHRLFVCDGERRVGVEHVDAGFQQNTVRAPRFWISPLWRAGFSKTRIFTLRLCAFTRALSTRGRRR